MIWSTNGAQIGHKWKWKQEWSALAWISLCIFFWPAKKKTITFLNKKIDLGSQLCSKCIHMWAWDESRFCLISLLSRKSIFISSRYSKIYRAIYSFGWTTKTVKKPVSLPHFCPNFTSKFIYNYSRSFPYDTKRNVLAF